MARNVAIQMSPLWGFLLIFNTRFYTDAAPTGLKVLGQTRFYTDTVATRLNTSKQADVMVAKLTLLLVLGLKASVAAAADDLDALIDLEEEVKQLLLQRCLFIFPIHCKFRKYVCTPRSAHHTPRS